MGLFPHDNASTGIGGILWFCSSGDPPHGPATATCYAGSMSPVRPRRLALLTLLAPLLLGAEGKDPIRLRFVFAAMDERERASLLDGVQRFNEARLCVRVDPVPYQWAGYGFHDSLVRMLALEDPSADIYRVDLPWIPELAHPGWLLPLDPYLDDQDRDAFVPVTLEGGSYQGVTYGLPMSLKGNLLFYRRDLLERHELAPPATIAELDVQARLLRREEGLPVGLALHHAYLYNDVLPVLWASGGEVLSLDGGQVLLDSPRNQAALQALVGLFGDDPWAPVPLDWFAGLQGQPYQAPYQAFAAGEVPFLISWSQRWGALRSEVPSLEARVGVAAIPGTDAQAGSSNLGSYYLAVSRFSEHPDHAADFVRFMASAEQQRRRIDLAGEVPAISALLEDAALLRTHPGIAQMAPALTRAGRRPPVPNEREVGGILEQAFHDAVTGKSTATEALGAADDQLKEACEEPSAPSPTPSSLFPEALPSDASWTRPLWLALAVVLAVLLPLGLLLWLRQRLQLSVLTTLRDKLLLFGSVTVVILASTSAGVAGAIAFRAQQRELAQQRGFFQDRMEEQAATLAKNLGLALSLLGEAVADQGEERARATLMQLLMASQFSEDLLFAELLDADGALLLSDQDGLYLEGEARRAAPPQDLRQRASSGAISTRLHALPGVTPHLEVLVPLYQRGVRTGSLRLGFSRVRYLAQLDETERRHERTLRQIARWSLAACGALLLLGLVAFTWFSRRLSRPIVALTRSAERIRSGDLEVDVRPGSRDELGLLAETMAEMVQGLRDRDFIKDAFGRYLTRELADQLTADPAALQLGGHQRQVTILMSDLRGFSGLAERLGPERMVGLLNRYLGAMTEVIHSHQGMINEFIGDAILVLFGALQPRPDDAARAIRCALAMQRALDELNRQSQAEDLPRLAMGIGVNSGQVVAGNIGSEQRVKYGVVGTPVNLAGRLESLTVGSQVLVSAETADASRLELVSGGPLSVEVKGRAEPLCYYEVRGIRGEPELQLAPVGDDDGIAMELLARVALLQGKRVAAEEREARTLRVGTQRIVMEGLSGVAPLDGVRLRLLLPPGRWSQPIYGKVLESGREGTELRTHVAITSAEPEDLAMLRRLPDRDG